MFLQVGSFEHNLTTDLLNHLVFVQKVFMKEVNEVIQKVSGKQNTLQEGDRDCASILTRELLMIANK